MEQSKDKKKQIGTAIGFAIGILGVVIIQQLFFKPSSFDKVMMNAASELNKTCPIMVDQETRLDNAVALPGNILQYNYTLVHMVKDSINLQDMQNYLTPVIINNVKTNPDLKIYRDHKTTMAYYYKDKNGAFVFKITVTPEQYGQ